MGYYLQAFICSKHDTHLLTAAFKNAVKVELGQGLDLVPMTEDLFDEINNYVASEPIGTFEYLTEHVEQIVLNVIADHRISYVEAEYHGGEGGQQAIIWQDRRRMLFLDYGQDRINAVLKEFGVVVRGGMDEFATLGFGLRRNTREWINDD